MPGAVVAAVQSAGKWRCSRMAGAWRCRLTCLSRC